MNTPDLTPLRIAAHNGDVNVAIQTVGGHAITAAAGQDLIRIVHDEKGIVGVHWAVNQATPSDQRLNLHLELTDKGRAALAEVTA